jgi:hypothetical protein
MAVENLTAENLVVENNLYGSAVPPAAPAHRYDFKDSDKYGAIYGYLGAISEEDQKRGVATPSVVRFRYTGFWEGAHHLQLINDSGGTVETDECAVPCVVIKSTSYNGQVHRLGYSSQSIIGAAFEDAMNGQLRRSPAPGTISEGYRFKGGDPGNASNWQPVSPPVKPAPAERNDAIENLTAENLVVENSF